MWVFIDISHLICMNARKSLYAFAKKCCRIIAFHKKVTGSLK
jgi:hypothetical protein